MIVSNEPGYYEDGNFGVRIENLAMIVEASTQFNFAGAQPPPSPLPLAALPPSVGGALWPTSENTHDNFSSSSLHLILSANLHVPLTLPGVQTGGRHLVPLWYVGWHSLNIERLNADSDIPSS